MTKRPKRPLLAPRRPLLARPEGAPNPFKEFHATDPAELERRRRGIRAWLEEAEEIARQEGAESAAETAAMIEEFRQGPRIDTDVRELLEADPEEDKSTE